jgi:hypothetical protein
MSFTLDNLFNFFFPAYIVHISHQDIVFDASRGRHGLFALFAVCIPGLEGKDEADTHHADVVEEHSEHGCASY